MTATDNPPGSAETLYDKIAALLAPAIDVNAPYAQAMIVELTLLIGTAPIVTRKSTPAPFVIEDDTTRPPATASHTGRGVRELEWEERGHVVSAASILGVYFINTVTNSWWQEGVRDVWQAATLDEAKAAAQQDYTQRILSALIREPVTSEGVAESRALIELRVWANEVIVAYDHSELPMKIHTYPGIANAVRGLRGAYDSALTVSPSTVAGGPEGQPTHRHKKRGSEYVLIGFGKMQAEEWFKEGDWDPGDNAYPRVPVDMREVAIYRSVDDGSLWVRPREEFEDGRFEVLPAAPQDAAPPEDGETK